MCPVQTSGNRDNDKYNHALSESVTEVLSPLAISSSNALLSPFVSLLVISYYYLADLPFLEKLRQH